MRRLFGFCVSLFLLSVIVGSAWSLPALPEPKSTRRSQDIVNPHRQPSLHVYASHFHPYLPALTEFSNFKLPQPDKTTRKTKVISLRDAILLALRNNPDIESSELQRINDKYSLETAWNQFQPKYTLGGSLSTQTGVHPEYAATGGVSLETPIGTTFSVDETNNLHGQFGTATLKMTQPLLKGFGKVNMVDYLNELDSQEEDRLTFKDSIMTAVSGVITAYRTLVSDYNQLDIQRKTFSSSEKTVKDDKLKVEAGQLPRSELLQDKVTLETNRLSVVQTENQLKTDYQALLTAIGLVSNANLKINTHIDIDTDSIPPLKKAIQLALLGNVSYQKSLISLRKTQRALITARDARKWSLGLTVQTTAGSEETDGVVSSENVAPSADLALSIPIDDISTKASLVSAKIAIETAKIALQQSKETLIRQVVNAINSLKSSKEQIKISREQVKLQRIALKNTELQYKYGQATSFSVSQQQITLLSDETSLVSQEISYLNAITSLHQLTGTLLHRWGIKLRY